MLTHTPYFFIALFTCLIGFSTVAQAHPTSKIKVVVFDFGGIIAKGDKSEIGHFIAKELDISHDDAMQAQTDMKQYLTQTRSEKDFWQEYAASLGKTLPDNWMEQLDNVRLKAIKEIPGTVAIVKKLQQQGFQTALLSNVRMSQARLKRQLGYYDLFHPVLLSYEIGVDKPDAKAYAILLDRLNKPASAVLFIDNKEENIRAAQSMGIDGIVFTDAHQLIKELKKRGIDLEKMPANSENSEPTNSGPLLK